MHLVSELYSDENLITCIYACSVQTDRNLTTMYVNISSRSLHSNSDSSANGDLSLNVQNQVTELNSGGSHLEARIISSSSQFLTLYMRCGKKLEGRMSSYYYFGCILILFY